MSDKKTLILIDGHALAFRQYYALERTALKNADNEPTWAVYGFFKAIFDLLEKIKPDFIAVAFDVGRQTFRVEKYEKYKANRETMPDTLRCQIGTIVEGLQAFDIPIYTKEGYEADDVIGTISKIASDAGNNTLILTGDQDSFQLIDKEGTVKVLIPSKGELIEYDWNKVYEKLGVYPNQVIDYKGLRGDTSDNIPGIRGIGEKTAQKLLSRYPHLEELLADCENIPEKAIKEKICTQKEIAVLSKDLATIIRNVDVNFDIKKACVTLPNLDKVSEFLRRMQFYTFIKNIDKILASFNSDEKPEQENLAIFTRQETIKEDIQQNLFTQAIKETVSDKNIEFIEVDDNNINEIVDKIKASDIISYRIGLRDGEIDGIAVSNGNNYYFDKKYLQNLKPVFENNLPKKVAYDAKSDYHLFLNNDIAYKGLFYDVLLASYVKDPNRKHTIEAQSLDFLNHIISATNTVELLCDEASAILDLHKYWAQNLDNDEKKLVNDIEIPLTMVLAKMEHAGVSIDNSYLKELSDYMTDKLAELEDIIYQLAGEPFNINSPKQVAEILFDKLELKTKKKKKSRSTGAEVLEELAEEYEICDYILQHRKFSKLKSTYTDSLPALVSKKDGRIHTTYNQALTVTGRLSSSNPNLQNIPIRTEEGNKIRGAFCANDKENYVILSADYSQIELRLLAHVSEDENLINAFKSGIDVHTLTASKVYGVDISEVTKEMRRKSKAVNFGIVYGQSKYGLAKNLGITNDEAQEFIDKYFENYPKVKDYMLYETDFVNKYGYVQTIFGRKRYLSSELMSPNYQIREFAHRAAINQPLQGTAADLIKMAMIRVQNELEKRNLKTKMIMQVHDELVFEVPKNELEEVKELVTTAMELEQPLKVPLELDINIGSSWKEG
ncbi:MAG: DNA polymerase I [bacterium]|nr:DNA polymerase I [bacterium]